MLARAEEFKTTSGKTNVDFIESKITDIALQDEVADCIISNCVVNLVPDEEKQLVFNEMFRLLKPGGRVAISDILARKPLPDRIRKSMSLYVGCIAGASQVSEYEQYLAKAGFRGTFLPAFSTLKCENYDLSSADVLITDAKSDLNVYNDPGLGSCCDSETKPARKTTESGCCFAGPNALWKDMKDENLNEWAGKYASHVLLGRANGSNHRIVQDFCCEAVVGEWMVVKYHHSSRSIYTYKDINLFRCASSCQYTIQYCEQRPIFHAAAFSIRNRAAETWS